jgi:predicted CXXCH cytochrome family protein
VPHTGYTLTTDACGTCHRTHTANGPNGVMSSPVATLPQSQLCFMCHNGTGANTSVSGRFAAARANVAATSSYYQHPATATPTAGQAHTQLVRDEFRGVLNRHSECGDCHNPHNDDATLSTQATIGSPWTASGALLSQTGAAVTNGAAGSAPTYALVGPEPGEVSDPQPPVPTARLTLEYQLCFKCHSGYTTLPAQDPSFPSRWALDKGIEFNPANAATHPVEGPGKNATGAMGASLGGASIYRVWTLTTGSTVRCTQCHGDPASTPTGPTANGGARLANHASPNRGILRANYRDRDLRTKNDPQYRVSTSPTTVDDFQLCYLCHATAPFDRKSKDPLAVPDTNFRLHGFHLIDMTTDGSSLTRTIDVAGSGSGNAVCSECHFRIHSTAFRNGTQGGTEGGLVNFSPNVTASGGVRQWTRTATGSGNCTLTCHGKDHSPKDY